MPDGATQLFLPTRKEALERLAIFAPKAGRAYAAGRNTDPGPGAPTAVSMLSPYLRRRMITEQEVLAEVLKKHTASASEKFIQEVFWRTYWKGWLEMRSAVWDTYLTDRKMALTNPPDSYECAIEGRTGIAGFDDWAHELVATGWLHNHARMWFASIWIFTLKLPWVLGADFFYRHLVDADPASNTLSWRWVAGLHTKGKTYLARNGNIEKYTSGRFRPDGLSPYAEPLQEAFDVPDPRPPRDTARHVPDGRYALLLTSDDLSPESWPGYDANPPHLVITTRQVPMEAELNSGTIAAHFAIEATGSTARRLNRPVAQVTASSAEPITQLHDLMREKNCSQLVMPYATCGPTRDFRDALKPALESSNIVLHEVKRSWDEHAWPHATRGFFKFKQKIPGLMSKADLGA